MNFWEVLGTLKGCKKVEAQVHTSEPVTIEAENVTSQKETAAQSSDTLKRNRSVNSSAKATPSLARRLKKMRAKRYNAKPTSEDTTEAEEGDHESLISKEPIIIESLPPIAKDQDTVPDTVFSVDTPAPILGKEALVKKFVEQATPVPWEDTHRGVEWTKKWNETDFIPSSKVLTEHIAKADELVINSVVKTQFKITALSTKNLQGLHCKTQEKVDKLLEKADKLEMETKLDKKRFIRPISEKVEAIEKTQEKQQAQISEKKKDDEADDQGNPSKGGSQVQSKGQSIKVSLRKLSTDASKSSTQKKTSSEAAQTQNLIASTETQNLISSSDEQSLTKLDILIQGGSQDSQKFMQNLKLKGKQTTVYYKHPKIQTLDEDIARRLFLKHNPGMDLKNLKEEEARFKVEKNNLKPKASVAKKPPRPKEKGILIKEKS
ncbi:hypothetical protein AgCh_033812 [Apium graveolens]